MVPAVSFSPPAVAALDTDSLAPRSEPTSAHGLPILIVPGLNGSCPRHWQSHWQRNLSRAQRVEQVDWDQPTLGEWTASLVEAVRQNPGALLVAHSLGCALVAHMAAITGGRGVGGALLVAPADVDRATSAGTALAGFAPMPRQRLPFPSVVVASRNDPFVAIERAAMFAHGWGAVFKDLGEVGHINVASGHGPWTEGLAHLGALAGLVGCAAPPIYQT